MLLTTATDGALSELPIYNGFHSLLSVGVGLPGCLHIGDDDRVPVHSIHLLCESEPHAVGKEDSTTISDADTRPSRPFVSAEGEKLLGLGKPLEPSDSFPRPSDNEPACGRGCRAFSSKPPLEDRFLGYLAFGAPAGAGAGIATVEAIKAG